MKKLDYLNQHGRPVSRRDFISRGLMAGGGMAFAPTLLQCLTMDIARAEGAQALPPAFLIFDLAGGAAMAGNFLVGGKGGPKDLLPKYDRLGWNPKAANALDERFGLPMAANNVSRMFTGMTQTMSAEAQKTFRFGSLCHIAEIDTENNPLSALSLISKSGRIGTELTAGLGLKGTPSGGRSRLAVDIPDYRPMSISKLSDLTKALGLQPTFDTYSKAARTKLAGLIHRLSQMQAQDALGSSDPETLKRLNQNYVDIAKKLDGSAALDPRRDPMVAAIYNINANSSETDPNVLRAGLVSCALKGLSGPAVITIDGCDYHDGSQNTGDTKDQEIGVEIGRAVELAHRMKIPLVIQIITDGGIYPNTGSRNWTGDTVDSCMTAVGYYNPATAPKYKDPKGNMQIGYYNEGQGAERSTLIGASPLYSAYGVFANYLQIAGRIKDFNALAPGIFTPQQLDSVLIFEG